MAAQPEVRVRARLARVLDEYCLSALGKSVAMAYISKLADDDDMIRVRRWWLRVMNNQELVAPADTPSWQVGCPEILEGLRARPVWLADGWNETELAWARNLEANADAIRSEVLALREGFQPYRSPSQHGAQSSTDAGAWNVYYLDLHGVDFSENRARCPLTCAILDGLPRAYGHAFFSATAPKTHITKHHGPTNKKLRCQLPLACPAEGCRLRVADSTLHLQRGKALVFDDSFEHEAWNDHATEARLVLIVDVWHPDLTDKEVKFLRFLQTAAMKRDKRLCEGRRDNFFAVIDEARGQAPDPQEIFAGVE